MKSGCLVFILIASKLRSGNGISLNLLRQAMDTSRRISRESEEKDLAGTRVNKTRFSDE